MSNEKDRLLWEEIIPVFREIAGKYTSKESSSISSEVAEQLLEGIRYSMEELRFCEGMSNQWDAKPLITDVSSQWISAAERYKLGNQRIFERVVEAKEKYHLLMEQFESYGCINYDDTIRKGLPVFFQRYDGRFFPQNHLLTLDYPSLDSHHGMTGIDLIDLYINDIVLEQRLLSRFDRSTVENLLSRVQPDYRHLYLDNLCNPVLLSCIGCVIADRTPYSLHVERQDCVEISKCFGENDLDDTERKMHRILDVIVQNLLESATDTDKNHFLRLTREYAVRVKFGIEHDCLETTFCC